jgi:hypothetical protein
LPRFAMAQWTFISPVSFSISHAIPKAISPVAVGKSANWLGHQPDRGYFTGLQGAAQSELTTCPFGQTRFCFVNATCNV